MSIRPVDLQVAVPKLAEADKVQKTLEQPQHSQTFANEVRQMLSKKERAVQPHDDVRQVAIGRRERRSGQQRDPEQKEEDHGEKKGQANERRSAVSRGLRGNKLDIRI